MMMDANTFIKNDWPALTSPPSQHKNQRQLEPVKYFDFKSIFTIYSRRTTEVLFTRGYIDNGLFNRNRFWSWYKNRNSSIKHKNNYWIHISSY